MKYIPFLASIICCATTAAADENDSHHHQQQQQQYCLVEDGQMSVCPSKSSSNSKTTNKTYDTTTTPTYPPRQVQVEFINKSSQHFHIKFIDPETLREDFIIWDLEPKNIDNSNFFSETIDSFTGHEFDVISAADQEEFRLRLVVDEEEVSTDSNKAVFTITDKMIFPGNVVQVEFINDCSHTFHVNFIDSESSEEDMIIANLQPAAASETVQSFPGHQFAVYDEDRTFRLRVLVGQGHEHGDHVSFRITDDMIHPQKPVDVEFINDTSSKQLHINYLDPDSDNEEMIIHNLSPGKSCSDSNFDEICSETIHSFTGHDFVAYDEERSFRIILHVDESHRSGDTVTFAITDEIIASL